MTEMLNSPEPVSQLIFVRHTKFNNQAGLTGEEAQEVVAKGLRHEDYDDWPLLPEGLVQAELLRHELVGFAIDACLCSPPERTAQTAKIVLRNRKVPTEFMDELRERNRGKYAYMPDTWSDDDPSYAIGKESTLNWRPGGEDAIPRAETLAEIIQNRTDAVLARADQLAPGGSVLVVAHAERIVAFRGVQRLANLDDQRFREPLVTDHHGLPPLARGKWFGQVQADVYNRRDDNPDGNMTHFRTFGYHKGEWFDSGEIPILRS